jgi:polar amino acid transport system ATP-binding protein
MSEEKKRILEINQVVKTFGDNVVLNGVSLSVMEHDVVVLCGPSGGGKSTLLRTINGLERIDSGTITYRDKLLTTRSIPEFRKHIGMVFQQFNLFQNLTVRDNLIAAPVKVRHMDRNIALGKACEYLETFGIRDKLDAYPHQLSGGQKQRVAIVRSLLMEPDIMLFDEPTSALDPEMIKEVLDAMRRLSAMGMTMVVVTHEMGFAREVATRMCFLQDAQIRVNTDTKSFFEHPDDPRLKQFLSMILKH